MNRTTLISAVLFALLLSTPTFAQEFREARGNVLVGGKVGLLREEAVRADLELTKEQSQTALRIARQADAMRTDLRSLVKTVWPEERAAKSAEVNKRLEAYSQDVDKKLQDVLSESQLTRLEEIYVQSRGVRALFDSKVTAKLGLTDGQKNQLANANKKYAEQTNEWAGSYSEANEERKALGDKRRASIKEFEDTVLSVLTAEQLELFRTIRGKPIDLSVEALRERRSTKRAKSGELRDR